MNKTMGSKDRLRCGLLTRVSTDRQARDPEGSLVSQLQRQRAYLNLLRAGGRQVDEVKTYTVPEGVSGATLDRRDIQDAVEDIEAGRINCLIVTELSRLSRSVLDFLKFTEFLNAHDCALISIKQNFDSSTPTGRMMITICVALAQFEREMTAERTSENFRARAERGLYNGGCRMLGYDSDPANKGHPIVNEQEAAIVRLAFDLYEQLASDTNVMNALNEKGYRMKAYASRRGRNVGGAPWTLNTVAYLLTNPSYAGLKEINKKNKTKDQSQLAERDRYRVVPGVWEGLISVEQFERVQKIRAANAKTKRSVATPARHTYLLRGLLVCDSCGTTLEPSWGTGRDGIPRFYYKHTRRAPKVCPGVPSLPAEEVERLVLDRVAYLGEHIEIVEECVSSAMTALNEEVPQVLRRLRERQGRLADLRHEAEGLLKLATVMAEDQRRAFLEPKLAKILDEKRATEEEVVLLEQSLRELKDNALSTIELQKALQTFDALFPELLPHEQQELVRYLIEEARIGRDFMVLTLYGKASADRIGLEKSRGRKEPRRSGFLSDPNESPRVGLEPTA